MLQVVSEMSPAARATWILVDGALRFPGRYVGKSGKIEQRNVDSVHKALGDNAKLLLGYSATRLFC